MRKVIFLFLIALQSLFAQENPKPNLDLNAAIQMAKQNNHKIQIASKNTAEAKAMYNQTNAFLLPHINAESGYYSTDNPMQSFGFTLSKKEITQQDFNPILLNNPDDTKLFNTKINAGISILNTSNLYQRKAAKKNWQMQQFIEQRTAEHIEFFVAKSYIDALLSRKVIENNQHRLEVAKAIEQLATNFKNQGVILEADALEANIYREQVNLELKQSINHEKHQLLMLKHLIGFDKENLYLAEIQLQPTLSTVSENSVESRADINAMKTGIEALKASKTATTLNWVPSLSAFGFYEWNTEDIGKFDNENYFAGVKLSWNLFSGSQNIFKQKQQKIAIEKNETILKETLEKTTIEISQTKDNIEIVKNAVQVYETALLQAEKSFEIRRNRFEQGLEKASDVLQSESMVSTLKLKLLETKYQLQTLQFYLEFLTK
ncbi:TolC family protein [Aureivirga sp. CE67]|uniref:TolC family protein n=1 Tax=Aureivirga sp. CE67 TaxID=1788983 RepID=UPI0018CB2ACF|nr:TolC family protein [Aureivirga sp. CE67]